MIPRGARKAVAALVSAIALSAGCAPALVWMGRSPDRRASARVTQDGARVRLVADGAAPRSYDVIAFERLHWWRGALLVPAQHDGAWWMIEGAEERGPFLAIDELVLAGEHAAYVATDRVGAHVIADGRLGAPFETIAEGLLVDAESGSVAYVVRRADGEHAVHDETVGPACELVALETLGAKGRMLAYLDRGVRDRLLVDHAEISRFERVVALAVASDEPHWAALVGEGDTTSLVRDGVVLFSAPLLTDLRISDDGAHVACLAPGDEGVDVIVDGEIVARHRHVDGERLSFVPSDARIVLVSEDAQGSRVTLGDHESARYEEIEGPVLAPGRAGWIGRTGDQSEIVIEGELVRYEESASELQLGRHDGYAYVAREGAERFVVTAHGRWPIPVPFVDSLVIDDDGRHWAALVPVPASRTLEVWLDGSPRGTVDPLEIGGATAVGADHSLREAVRAIVRAELASASTMPL